MITLPRLISASIVLVTALLAIGWLTREDPASKPYLDIVGRGFLFNYRVADTTYGFTAMVIRPLAVGSTIEAVFEDPSGAEPHVVRKRVGTDTVRYGFQSPPVRGVEAGRPYRVDVRVLSRQGDAVLWTHSFEVRSQLFDQVLPDRPLTVGPGYARNPDE